MLAFKWGGSGLNIDLHLGNCTLNLGAGGGGGEVGVLSSPPPLKLPLGPFTIRTEK